MDYEKLHKYVITNLQEMVNSGKITVEIARRICADFVPESEDEMARQEMLAMFSNADDYGLEKEFVKRAIAYLEKLGKPTEINPSEFDLQLNRLLKQFESLPKDDIVSSLNFYLNVVQNDGIYKKEKQTEQKPINKIKQQNIYKNGVYQEANGVRIWHNGYTFLVPKDWNKGEWPLLNKKGRKNSKQNKERLMNEMNALLDWDFVAATKHIQNLGTDIPLKDKEYLMTAPVWLTMYEHRIELNKALNNIGAMEIDFNKTQWFAQRSYINRAWFFYGISGSLENSRVTFAFQVGIIML